MKITSKIIYLLVALLLPVGFVACDDDDDIPDIKEQIPEFVLGQESIKVKIGMENKVTVDVKQGGEYDAFILDERIAKAEVSEGAIKVEGFANGLTYLMVSDKYNRYRKLPVMVYTTDELVLSQKEFELVSVLGNSKTGKVNVVLGNGGYQVASDKKEIKVAVNDEGEISITATSKKEEFTANITVTDCTGLSANLTVKVVALFEPYTTEELEAIKKDSSRIYSFNGEVESQSDFTFVNELIEGGKQRYGWDIYGIYYCYIDFNGGKEEGIKTDATCTSNMHGLFFQPVNLEVIKNDGTQIWVVYSFVDEEKEKINYGYFCDFIEKE